MIMAKLFVVNMMRPDVKVRVRSVHDRVGICRQSQIAVSTAFSTGKEESRRRARAFRQVSQNQELTKICPVYCAVNNDRKTRPQMARGPRSNRTGNRNSALRRPRTPVTAMPKMRRGRVISHTKGYITSASNAMGQHKTNRMHHRKKAANGHLARELQHSPRTPS